jgi:acetyl esterase/lipase
MRTAIILISLILSIGTLLIMIWSVVPQPNSILFRVSVGAAEWSLWFGAAALIGVCLGAWANTLGHSRLASFALVCGLIAILLAAIPPTQAVRVALREGVALSLTRYLFGASPTPSVEETRDVEYARIGGHSLRLDVYRAAAREQAGAAPAVIVIHGGSWNSGTKGEFSAMSRTLARDGAVVFDINYRLASPAQPFPAQIADVLCAIGWVKGNAATYGVDPQRIALLGRSAGGQLALLAAYAADDPRLSPSCAVGDTSVRAVVSFYAPTDLAWGYDHPLRPDVIESRPTLENYIGGTPRTDPDAYALASPTTHVQASSPPSLLIHGRLDRLVGVQHARFMAQALERAGVPHRVLILPWANHGFDYVSDGWGAQISEAEIKTFLATNL